MSTDLLITQATVLAVGTDASGSVGDVSVSGGRITAVGGVHEEARRTALRTIDGTGATVVPLVVHTIEEERPVGTRYVDKEIAVGNQAMFAVVRRTVARREAVGVFAVQPRDLVAVVLEGKDVVGGVAQVRMSPLPEGDERLGTWIDRTDYLHQTLDVRGRYDETRAGRKNAWTGQYWVAGDRIVYLDDTGFWAFGEFAGDELHHAGYVMRLGG